MVMTSSRQKLGRVVATWQRTCGVDVPPKILGQCQAAVRERMVKLATQARMDGY